MMFPKRSLLRCEGLNNQSYVCESGHCCGESQCCSYYYELWWFWLVWVIILILSCCCVCHHRRTKHRLQQQQRQHEINLIAYREAHSYASVPFYFRFLPNYLLPDYEEVVNRPPTPPPPYSVSHTGTSAVASPLTSDPQDVMGHCLTIQTTPTAAVSDALPPRPSLEEPQHIGTPNIGFNRNKAAYKQEEPLDGGPGLGPQEALTEGPVSPVKNCKEPLFLRDLGPEAENAAQEDKDRGALGRRRRFTGDSGIEVCVCGRGGSTGSGREMESLLGEDEDEDVEGDFCDGCAHRSADVPVEEPAPALEGPVGRAGCMPETGSPTLPPPAMAQPPHPAMCLLTINEQEGPPHPSAEPQG
ncbi:WW domain binding protein 1-like b isoform X2 [Esox lucius]|uniref:WW domain binding protein 1-like b n=1 Tax=Esox lucius TaxID=8010 RepID=A0AAY5KSU6_ESOLU|nr:WW domain binding protein 1-like b isoform X2 [Esox lucius]